MIIYIFNQEFQKIGQLDSYISLQWTEEYQGSGTLTLVCADDERYASLLMQGYYLYKREKRTAMVIRYIKHDAESKTIEVHGYTTLDLLSQRIIYPLQEISEVEKGMYDLVESAFLKSSGREASTITTKHILEGLAGYNVLHESQFCGSDVYKAISDLVVDSELGYYMYFDLKKKRHVFTVYRGEDRTQGQKKNPPKLFAVEYGNLQNLLVTDDMSIFKNVAYVAGKAEENESRVVVVGEANELDRFEIYVDANDLQQEYKDGEGNDVVLSNAQYEANLRSRGMEKLNEQIRARSFSGEINPIGFGTDFYLGDKVTCKSDQYNLRLDARITRYTEVTENNVTTLELSFGDPEITLIQEVKTWL